MKARDVMTTPVVTIDPGMSLRDVIASLIEHNVSSLPVVNRTGMLLGIVTEADLVGHKANPGPERRFLCVVAAMLSGELGWRYPAARLTAADVMTPFPLAARPDDGVYRLAQRMTEERIKRLPIVEHGRVVGMVTRHDLVAAFGRMAGSAGTLDEVEVQASSA